MLVIILVKEFVIVWNFEGGFSKLIIKMVVIFILLFFFAIFFFYGIIICKLDLIFVERFIRIIKLLDYNDI